MAERPGIMFYFSILDDLEDFSTEEIGELFVAMMKYGQTGEITEFDDRGMRSIWRSMMKYVDQDQKTFDKKILQKQFAGWKSAQIRKGVAEAELPSFTEWKSKLSDSTTVNDRTQPSTTVNDRQPTINNQLSITNNQLPIVNNQLSVVNNQLSSSVESIDPGKGVKGGEPELLSDLPTFNSFFNNSEMTDKEKRFCEEKRKQWLAAREKDEIETMKQIRLSLERSGFSITETGVVYRMKA